MNQQTGRWVKISKVSSVSPGSVVGVKVGDLEIALYNVDGSFYATHDICTHAHAFLSDGWLEGDIIECPLHGGRFEVKTGKGLGAPITCDATVVPVRVDGDDVEVMAG